MKQDEFDQLTAALDALSPSQRHQLLERLQRPETIPAIIEQLERNQWDGLLLTPLRRHCAKMVGVKVQPSCG